MKVLVVAAGKGSRLNKDKDPIPKPLHKIKGKYIIQYVIENFKAAGVTDFYLVVGFMKEVVKKALGDGSIFGVNISYIDDDEYIGNGLSLFKSRNDLDEPFILSMSDHIFHPEVIKKFVQAMKGKRNCYLCTDKNIREVLDIDDATKVLEEGGRIRRIHKTLTNYNSIDCGVFYLTPDIFHVLEKTISTRDLSISGAIQSLANANIMFTYDIEDGKWMDIDTEEDMEYFIDNITRFT